MLVIKNSIYTALAIRFLLAILLFFLCRLFFFWFNYDYFSNISTSELIKICHGGLFFDIAGILYLLIPYVLTQTIPLQIRFVSWYQNVFKWFYIIPISLGVLTNLADTVYFHVTLDRSNITLFNQFSNEENMVALFGKFLIEYWYVFLLFLLLTGIIYWIDKIIFVKQPQYSSKAKFYLISSIMLILIWVNVMAGIRGGYSHSVRPITLSNANKYISQPNQRALVLNTPFTFIRTLNVKGLKEVNYFNHEKQVSLFSAKHSVINLQDSVFKNKNVVMFILESFGREHIGVLNTHIDDYKGFTPFIDSLINYSYTFKYAFANGQKSITGMSSNIASIPSMEIPFVLSHYSGNQINSLASVLKEKNYSTAFFHGAANGSMGFDAFAKQSGFDAYYGMTEYGSDKDFDGIWGIWDEEFMQYFANQMDTMKQPFFTALFSVSSHHPFKVPEKYANIFPEGNLPIQKTIAYTDFALKRFFEKARKSDWFNNTIFIITADHSSTYNENSIKEYKTLSGVFSIPLIFYCPSQEDLKGFDDSTVVQQIDIMPTVLNYLNYPKDYIAFGTDVLDSSIPHFAINYESGSYILFKDEYLIRFDGKEIEGFYNYRTDPHLSINLASNKSKEQGEMLNLIKAFIQEYNRRMIRNQLTESSVD